MVVECGEVHHWEERAAGEGPGGKEEAHETCEE
jgi:hypothetical protein